MKGLSLLYRCKKCRAAFSIPATDPDVHLLKKHMRCPNSQDCEGKQYLLSETNLPAEFSVTQISAVQFYQATMGVGLPKERKCGPAAMRKILLGARITDLHIDEAPSKDRSILYSLALDNGNTIHIASSTKGATIYRVTEPPRGR